MCFRLHGPLLKELRGSRDFILQFFPGFWTSSCRWSRCLFVQETQHLATTNISAHSILCQRDNVPSLVDTQVSKLPCIGTFSFQTHLTWVTSPQHAHEGRQTALFATRTSLSRIEAVYGTSIPRCPRKYQPVQLRSRDDSDTIIRSVAVASPSVSGHRIDLMVLV